MKQRNRTVQIKRYTESKQIPTTFYFLLDSKFESIKVQNMLVMTKGCISLLIKDLKNKYYLYYPFEESECFQDVDRLEAESIFATKVENTLDYSALLRDADVSLSVEIKSVEVDSLGNLWILNSDNDLLHFIKTPFYESTKLLEQIFTNDNQDTVWSNLYMEWDLPLKTSMVVEVKVDDGDVEVFVDTPDILLYEYEGKELHLSIRLESMDGSATPRLDAIKVVYNQKLYVDYLPAYYQQEKEVLSRYLSIFQSIMGEFEDEIEQSASMLNPEECDEAYLDWLSSLLGIARDYRWEEQRWRNFLMKAPSLYKGLGTKKSMQDAIALYCDEKPEIVDDYEDKRWTFCVKISEAKIKTEQDVEVIESIIQAFKPAHTNGRLMIGYEEEAFIVGNSALAINTKIQ